MIQVKDAIAADEFELKYLLEDGQPIPEPTALGRSGDTGEFLLNALYFDTPDFELLRNQVTLRRRSGGEDAGWHLKSKGAAEEHRIELRLPISGARPPMALRQALPEDLRGRPLVPIIRLRTLRKQTPILGSQGEVIATFCLDRVAVTDPRQEDSADSLLVDRTISWSEVELELVSGSSTSLAGLGSQLRALGLRSAEYPSKLRHALDLLRGKAPLVSTTGEAASIRNYAFAQIGTLQALEEAVLENAPDAVHQVRVAARRLRSTLRTFGLDLFGDQVAPVIDELKWFGAVLGAARDAEVMTERIGLLAKECDPSGAVEAEDVLVYLANEHQSALVNVEAAMKSPRYEVLQDYLAELCAPGEAASKTPNLPGWGPASIGGTVGKAGRRFVDVLRLMGGGEGNDKDQGKGSGAPDGQQSEEDRHATVMASSEAFLEAWHSLRKTAKQVRYGYEALRGTVSSADALASAWERVSDTLGTLQDSAVASRLLRGQVGAGGDSALVQKEERTRNELLKRAVPEVALALEMSVMSSTEPDVEWGIG